MEEDVTLTTDGISVLVSEDIHRTPKLQVVDVYRYARDASITDSAAITFPPLKNVGELENLPTSTNVLPILELYHRANVFDIVLTDSITKLKCLLSPIYNSMVFKGLISAGAIITVLDWKVWKEGLSLVEGLVVLRRIAIQASPGSTEFDPAQARNIPYYRPPANYAASCSLRGCRSETKPLLGDRAHYLNFFCDDCIVSDKMHPHDISFISHFTDPRPLEIINNPKYPSIRDVCRSFLKKTKNQSSRGGAVVGRIISMSRIQHWPKIGDKRVPWPISFQFQIADDSDKIDVVVWGPACCSFHQSIEVGDIVVIANYRIRQSFPDSSGLEFSINAPNGQ